MKYNESVQNQSITACYIVKSCYDALVIFGEISLDFTKLCNFSINPVKV